LKTLDLYASIEKYLGFEKEIQKLHTKMKELVVSKKDIKTLIDIGCGQGEFCKLIENNNIKTLGVDLSAKQIAIAKLKNLNAEYINIKDITTHYDCATAVFDVVNYIEPSDMEKFLKNTFNLLNDDGYFIFDINSLYGFEEVADGTLTIDNEDEFIAIDANFEDNILYTDITLFSQQKDNNFTKEMGTIEQYYYSIEKLTNMLISSKFKVEEVINFKLHENSEADDKFIFVCRKDSVK